ncbi:MAG: hypothetical protein DHS20C06_00300 [Hyphobacterium sp.]|nr:MAG: hypothetical protein DHS20C06_00300 [Hyphobacterium sp.]
MRILLSICTVLASASLAEAQLGSVTGTVQQTTDLEREELQLESTSRLGSRLQTGRPTSRLELMRQQRAVRDARRAAVAARETTANDAAAPQAQTSAVTQTTLDVEDTAHAAAQTQSGLSARRDRIGGAATANGDVVAGDFVDSTVSGQASAIVEPSTSPIDPATSRVLTAAEIAARAAPASVSAAVPETPRVQVQTPGAVVVSQGPSRTYTGPVTRSDTVVIRDRRIVEDRTATQAPAQSRSATPPPVANRAASRSNDTMWISRYSIGEHAFPLGCALLLILSMLLALRLLAAPRRRRA